MTFLRYEYEWFFAAAGTSRTGTETNINTTSATTTSGEYQQGQTARFEVRAVFTDTHPGTRYFGNQPDHYGVGPVRGSPQWCRTCRWTVIRVAVTAQLDDKLSPPASP